jgi:phosphoribosylformimino-5-aminoimidazole carboxamide ribotide isomerase
MQIIPAIDLIDGQCVRLTQGDYEQKKVYHQDPLEAARIFEGAGLKRLHLVDLDGAKAGQVKNWKVLEKITAHTDLIVDFGGGVKSSKDVEIVLQSGAALVTIGSKAVKDPVEFSEWLQFYGPDKFLLGADVRDEFITISGWLETTKMTVYEFIGMYIEKGVMQFFCTDVRKDGKLEGPSISLYQRILERFPDMLLIASGGVSRLEDLQELQSVGCSGAIVGKAIYEGRITTQELVGFSKLYGI